MTLARRREAAVALTSINNGIEGNARSTSSSVGIVRPWPRYGHVRPPSFVNAGAGVRALDLGERHPFHPAGKVRGAIERGIVNHHDVAVGGEVHVHLERINADRDRLTKRLDRVFGGVGRVAPVSYDGKRFGVE